MWLYSFLSYPYWAWNVVPRWKPNCSKVVYSLQDLHHLTWEYGMCLIWYLERWNCWGSDTTCYACVRKRESLRSNNQSNHIRKRKFHKEILRHSANSPTSTGKKLNFPVAPPGLEDSYTDGRESSHLSYYLTESRVTDYIIYIISTFLAPKKAPIQLPKYSWP